MVVQQEASKFIHRLFLKSAFEPSLQTFIIHRVKNKTMGIMHIAKMKKSFNCFCSTNVKNMADVAKAKTIPQKTKVPFLPNL